MYFKRLLLLAIVFSQMRATLSAHHSTVAYAQKSIVLKNATITKVIWADPHVVLTFAVKEASGTVTT